jgi:hypothetical protein
LDVSLKRLVVGFTKIGFGQLKLVGQLEDEGVALKCGWLVAKSGKPKSDAQRT